MQKMNEASTGLTIKEMRRQDRHTGWFPGTEKKTCNVPALNCFYGSTEQGCMPSCFPWLEIHQLKDLFGIGRVTHFLLQLWEGGF